MVAREEDLRDVDAAKARRTGVGGVIEGRSVPERLGLRRLGADHALDAAHRRVHDRHCRNLAAGEDEVAERNLFERIQREEPLVDPFVVPAQNHEPLEPRVPDRVGLFEAAARRAGEDQRAPLAARRGVDHRVEGASQRFDPHYHPGTAAVRRVVGALAALAEVEQMM